MRDRAMRLLPAAANDDGEFAIAARMWDADVMLVSGADAVRLTVRAGVITEAAPAPSDAAAPIRIVGPPDGWEKLLRAVPPPFYQDLFGAAAHHAFTIEGAIETCTRTTRRCVA
ncbi:MAG: hypothetical protein M3P30_00580 [Chloroflexota bacterium]|nr:hypothetical protein [Chloroflexota bacterium]